jgi:hypothetical protein
MTLEELCEEEPLVKDIFDKADSIDRKELKHL